MEKIRDIIERVEQFAPLSTQQEWDNSGWQIEPCLREAEKVLLTLDADEQAVRRAKEAGCHLILSHHPLFFSPIKSLKYSFITDAIKNDIAIYAAHTNLDIANGGVNDMFASICGFTELTKLNEFVKYAKLNTPQNIEIFIKEVKSKFNIEHLKISNLNKREFETIAFCSGSGGEFVDTIEDNAIDVYLTGDVKYHHAQALRHSTIIDTGHYNSEICAIEVFKNILSGLNVELIDSKGNDVFKYI